MQKLGMARGGAAALAMVVLAALTPGCGDDTATEDGGEPSGEGTIAFDSWGEEYIEQGIPASEFADGWSVTFQRFLVLVGKVKVADEKGTVAAEMPGYVLFDHVAAGVKPVVTFDQVGAKAWTHVSYQTSPAAAAEITPGPGATAADVTMMATNACHAYVEGTLTNGTDTVTFKWCLSEPTLLDTCEGEIDGKLTEGAVVTEGGTDQIQLTIHGDHFFYDDLQSSEAVLRGQALFDADNGDGDLTLAELDAVPLDTLPPDQYGVGATSVTNLGDFVRFLSRTLGHFRGEGECFVKDP